MGGHWRVAVLILAAVTVGPSIAACGRQADATRPASPAPGSSADERQTLKHYISAFNGLKGTFVHWTKTVARAKASEVAREEPSITAAKLEIAARQTGGLCTTVAAMQVPPRLRTAHRRLLRSLKGVQSLLDDVSWLYRDASHGILPGGDVQQRLLRRERAVSRDARAWEAAVKREMKRLGLRQNVKLGPATTLAA